MNRPQISRGRASVGPAHLIDSLALAWEIHAKTLAPRPTFHVYVDELQITAQKTEFGPDWLLVSVHEFTDHRTRLGLSLATMPRQVGAALDAFLEGVRDGELIDDRTLQYS
ncbi:hypothetical protein ACFWBH_03295 [Streptomyces sp. NPDC059999]|uniref:hypothetical protein n=1 Tax=Streptomyces sp. NPDC059999 TaxID=3347030 RepID=UPI003696C442